jgi:hypothetical protein
MVLREPWRADVSIDDAGLDTTVVHPARRYNYWLGGKDNFAVDRASADLIEKVYPSIRTAARENRAFLQRAVRFLTDSGVRQFLDIGTGLPTADNTHEVAQRIDPSARVVYVDNDPMVMAHARALLTTTTEGRTVYLQEDLRNPDKILTHPELLGTLELTEPVGLVLVAVLHFFADQQQAEAVVRTLLDAVPSGSYLVASNSTLEYSSPEEVEGYQRLVANGQLDVVARSHDEFGRFFAGLELVPPGIGPVSEWRPTVAPDERPSPDQVAIACAVGRKP